MGVHGLWELLAPVGRRVSVETLAGKKLAIDASIWMVQFMKAMRDDKGEMIRNAHLLGFFRRICKLMFLRTKPIFVFDGGTPAFKRRTVIARRRQRESAQGKVRKTAEKLLLNHLKAMKLKELAKDLQNQNQRNDSKGKKTFTGKNDEGQSNSEKTDLVPENYNHEKLDEMSAASMAVEENEGLINYTSTSAVGIPFDAKDDEVQTMLTKERKLKEPVKDMENEKHKNDVVSRSINQEMLDEMLAASIAAEEDQNLINNASTSAAAFLPEDDGSEDEEIILPAMHASVDPAVLAALPPSMQLDLLVQMREQLMAENRQKYQKVKKAPADFSALQIQSYLKTVAFRREIDEVQKSAAGKGVGGVQISRIASEANREFIFSSSYTGDKQDLASAGVEGRGYKQQQTQKEHHSSDLLNTIASNSKSDTVAGSVQAKPGKSFDKDVETYVDERGCIRVSRVRAMGMRMTCDLQRNLDLMREVEQERRNLENLDEPMLNSNSFNVPRSFPGEKQFVDTSNEDNCETINSHNRVDHSMLKNATGMEISFEDDGDNKCFDGSNDDDDLFARLVAVDPVTISSDDKSPSRKQPSDSASDCEWEETIIEGKDICLTNDVQEDIKCPHNEGSISYKSEVQCKEAIRDVPKITSSCLIAESGTTVSRGYLEEQADLHEAIKRSLDDLRGEESVNPLLENNSSLKSPGEKVYDGIRSLARENNLVEPHMLRENVTRRTDLSFEIVDSFEKPNINEEFNISETSDSSGRQLIASVAQNFDTKELRINKPSEQCLGSDPQQLHQNVGEEENLDRYMTPVIPFERTGVSLSVEQLPNISYEGGGLFIHANKISRDDDVFEAVSNDLPDSILVGDQKNENEAESSGYLLMKSKPIVPLDGSSINDPASEFDYEQKMAAKKEHDNYLRSEEHNENKSATKGHENVQAEVTEADLEEEIQILDQERIDLGEEQRKLERNAESVSSEMFAECQELLQMFGLPYIIAPMEAEAQCAYMELANLVDGVVTDDSDVFLFGAQSVYKNIFDDRKYVETYLMKDIQNELGLTREKLIRMALLLGSDYTEGVSGIGIVNAVEVVNAFPEQDGLQKFREWIESPDPTILGKLDAHTGSSLRKRGPKVSENSMNRTKSSTEVVDENISEAYNYKQIFMENHRNVSKNWHIPLSFPSEAIFSAYASPQVDKSTDPFSWGKPDLSVLRKLCWEKFGWGNQKADELLLPVLKEYSKHETQLRLEAFYSFNERFAKIRSKRIKKAVKGITGKRSFDLMDDTTLKVSRSRKGRNVKPSELGDEKSEELSNSFEGSVAKSTAKARSRKRKITKPRVPSEDEDPGLPMCDENMQSSEKGSCGNLRGGRGRGRGRARRRGWGAGGGRRKGSLGVESSATSSYDGNSGDEREVHRDKFQGLQEVRRSVRSRKPANYTATDMEIDIGGESSDQNAERCYNEEGFAQEPSGSHGTFEDTSGGLDETKQHRAGDASVQEDFCRDHHKTEGGLCMDEDAIVERVVKETGNPALEAEISKDYLKMGGGFCTNEEETNENQDFAHFSATTTFLGNAYPSHGSASMDEADPNINAAKSIDIPERAMDALQDGQAPNNEKNYDHLTVSHNVDHSKGFVDQLENAKVDTGTTPVVTLSAMPYLKRNRRKR